MYDIPDRTDIRKCIITEETIRSGRLPLLLTKTESTRASTRRTTRSGSRSAARPRSSRGASATATSARTGGGGR